MAKTSKEVESAREEREAARQESASLRDALKLANARAERALGRLRARLQPERPKLHSVRPA